jgi:hypothetical protein
MIYYPHFVLRRKEFVNRKKVKPSDIRHSRRLEQTTTTTKTPVLCPVPARLTFYTNCASVPTRADIFCLLWDSTRVRELRNLSGNIRGNLITWHYKIIVSILKVCVQNATDIFLSLPWSLLTGKEIVTFLLNAQSKAVVHEMWSCDRLLWRLQL